MRPMILALIIFSCCLTTATVRAHAQFSNLRVFRAGDLFNKDYWRPVDALKSAKKDAIGDVSSRKGEIGASSPIKRVSMSTLLQQLSQKIEAIPIKAADESTDGSLASTESSHATSPILKESVIRRVQMRPGSISYSRNLNASSSDNGQQAVIQVSINPHLKSSTTTFEPTTTSTTTTTTEPTTTTTTTEASTTSEQPTAKSHVKQQLAKKAALQRAGHSGKKLSDMPNSPIYYIKLPPSAFVSMSGRTPHSEDSLPFELVKQLQPIFVATTQRPATNATAVTTESSSSTPSPLSTTTRKPPRTNSRIINIKGPFVFNGKPGGIYSAPAPYRPPNYLDLLHSLYPKFKRAQFIRRR